MYSKIVAKGGRNKPDPNLNRRARLALNKNADPMGLFISPPLMDEAAPMELVYFKL
jgi:hypothetical protein